MSETTAKTPIHSDDKNFLSTHILMIDQYIDGIHALVESGEDHSFVVSYLVQFIQSRLLSIKSHFDLG